MKHESIESFLARGGEIKIIPRGQSNYMKKPSRHITYSRKANPNIDMRATRRKDNEKFYK